MTAGKTIALTRQTFVDKVMSLLFNILLRKCQPTPVFLPGESHGQRSLVGYSPRGYKESDTTERIHFTSQYLYDNMKRGNICLTRVPEVKEGEKRQELYSKK